MNLPWTFDQFQRYAVLRAYVEACARGGDYRVLDVGGVSPGVGGGAWLPAGEMLKSETSTQKLDGGVFALDLADCSAAGFIKGDGSRIPFKGGSFDVVSAMDVLEHIPRSKRRNFIGELCRVSRDAVIVCAPDGEKAVESAEAVVASAIREQLGIENEQLREHRENGLPGREEVDRAFAEEMGAGESFCSGSLARWLLGQTVRGFFLGRRETPRFLEAVDKYMISTFNRTEFVLSPYRRFWIFSKRAGSADLESFRQKLPQRMEEFLRELTEGGEPNSYSALKDMAAEFGRQEIVSAVVVSEGNKKRLHSCLQHLLSQRVDFDFEVCVWPLEGGEPFGRWIKDYFPGVRILRAEEKEGLLEILLKLRGESVLMIRETVDLDQEAVGRVFRILKEHKAEGIILVRNRRRRFFTAARLGGRFSPFKFLAGRVPKLMTKKSADREVFVYQKPGGWTYGECLYFRRKAIFKRQPSVPRFLSPKKREVFFWRFEKQ